jgi:uncharacterized membrane protein YqaE (UPF0057 family)
MEKRVYSSGYHIDWKSNTQTAKKSDDRKSTPVETTTAIETAQIETSNVEAVPSIASNDEFAAVGNSIVIPKTSRFNLSTKTNVETTSTTQAATNVSKKSEFAKTGKSNKPSSDVPLGLLYVLCILIPFVAVGLVTDWDVKTVVINLLWTLLCGIPGVIHAFIVVGREY